MHTCTHTHMHTCTHANLQMHVVHASCLLLLVLTLFMRVHDCCLLLFGCALMSLYIPCCLLLVVFVEFVHVTLYPLLLVACFAACCHCVFLCSSHATPHSKYLINKGVHEEMQGSLRLQGQSPSANGKWHMVVRSAHAADSALPTDSA